MNHEPVAIVGRGCVLPGCLTPAALWRAVSGNTDLTTAAPSHRWGLNPAEAAAMAYRGGYVHGFDSVFDAQRFALDTVDVAHLDPVVQWPLHAVFEAWNEAACPRAAPSRTGVILANLSYPTRGKSDLACDFWLDTPSRQSPLDGFSSGLPAQLIAQALGATGIALALDAACASSLYALQIACRKLQERQLDLAFACAVNAADELIIQRGFDALQALSPTSRSQPFAASADGLLPAQGATALVLKRLSDVAPAEPVFGVIRAIGLSNDGRRGGFLVPDAQGQLEAMRRAYDRTDIDPSSIDYLECHATGTQVGDTVEIQAASELFGERTPLPVGSLKGNVGHLITAAGMASVLKLTSAFEHESLPPTRLEGAANPAFDGSCLQPLRQAADWPAVAPRRAAISNFGFGGNNAHLILEACQRGAPKAKARTARRRPPAPISRPVEAERFVICGIGALAGPDRGIDRIVRRLMSPPAQRLPGCSELMADARVLRTPPDDLRAAEPQQLALLDVADEAMQQAGFREANGQCSDRFNTIGADRFGVFAGMGCANDAARWPLLERLANRLGCTPGSNELLALQRQIGGSFGVADVLGAMPNLTANRLNAAFDARGQGYSIAAEAQSGRMAIQAGCDALRAGDIDVAIIAAADFASEPVRRQTLARIGSVGETTDLAAALVLVRASVAEEIGARVLATLTEASTLPPDQQPSTEGSNTDAMQACDPPATDARSNNRHTCHSAKAGAASASSESEESAEELAALLAGTYGVAPVADFLFTIATATGLAARAQFISGKIARPALARGSGYRLKMPGEPGVALDLPPSGVSADPVRGTPLLFHARAESIADLCDRLSRDERGGQGTWRIAILADDQAGLDRRRERAQSALSASASASAARSDPSDSSGSSDGADGADVSPGDTQAAARASNHDALRDDDIYIGQDAPIGELAFVFTGVAAAYPRMGRGLFLAFPELGARLAEHLAESEGIAHLLAQAELDAHEQLCAVTLLSQTHSLLLRDMAGLAPDAVLGLSLGETNALIAFDMWRDASALLDDIEAGRMYEQHLGGRFETAAIAWETTAPVVWENWRILASVTDVQNAVENRAEVDITIIYSDEECVIGGSAAACAAVIASLSTADASRMAHPMIVHTPALQPYADTWRRLHTRPTKAPTGMRVYSCADNASYTPDDEATADRLTRQALQTIDWRKTIEQAWDDGVRTFIEIGPCDTLTRSIHRILDQREHLAVATDRIECADVAQITRLLATLFASGHVQQLDTLADRLIRLQEHPWRKPGTAASVLRIPVVHVAPGAAIERFLAGMPPAPCVPPPQSTHPALVGGKVCSAAPTSVPPVSAQAGQDPLFERSPSGPSFDRDAIERSTTGAISRLFGDRFERQDDYLRQVRLPAPPLLLVHRITGIDAEPGEAGSGVIWTETDVEADSWYLHAGAMRPGPLVEAGQADLSLISWMGADFLNRSERVYRLLGCEMTIHEPTLPAVGDRLRYQIEITGHANVGDVRLFFFQYDCRLDDRLLISVRNGRAGFFTDDELAAGAGVLADPTRDPPPTASPPAFDTQAATSKRALSSGDLQALREGDGFRCFGPGFEACAAHSNPPCLPGGRLALLDEVPVFEPAGGPWQRGYLRATTDVPLDAWFYEGHFHQDPCMPGTLMAEAAVQALELFAMASGLAIDRDGWVFAPVPGVATVFDCRGQVVPDRPHRLSYEVFVDHIVDGDMPEVHASLMASCDGHKVFHCPHYAIRLRRNWPASPPLEPPVFIGPRGETRGDATALQACGNGAPSEAFGEMYRRFDHHGSAPRLPQPPYHVISRVLSVSTRPGQAEAGATASFEYDIPPDAWYFADSRCATMPLAVLLEVVLQPCGWLASHSGFALQGGEVFRNLDGDALFTGGAKPDDGSIQVVTTMTRFAAVGSMTIVHFELEATLSSGCRIAQLQTSFGFFPRSMLRQQAGLAVSDAQKQAVGLPAALQKLDDSQGLLPDGRLSMFDQIDHFDAKGGRAGLGFIRAQQAVDPYAWYFRAHFYQDPVQPGSLGIDALLQVLMSAVLLKGLTRGMRKPRLAWGSTTQRMNWSYRGQVTPRSRRVTLTVDLLSIQSTPEGVDLRGSGDLWCDNLRIYTCENLSLRLFDEEAA